MAAPTFVQASDGLTDAGGAWLALGTFPGVLTVGNIVILQVLQDGGTSGAVGITSASVALEALDGTDQALTYIGEFPVGGSSQAFQHIWIGRALQATNQVSVSGTNSTAEDVYARYYEFANVSTGTTLATVIENGSAGATANGAGTSATIADTGVTTLGADRLALNFVAGNDDNALDAFTGESGGDWTEAVAEYAESAGTDGVIGLQVATIASAGTINGGTDGWVDGTDSWGVVGFALIGTTAGGPTDHEGAVVLPVSFNRVVAAKVAAKSAIVLPESFNRVVTAKVTAKSAVTQTFSFGRVVNGARLTKGAVVSPFAFNRVVNSTRIARSSVVSPFAFNQVVTAKVTAKSAVVQTYAFNRVVNGVRIRFGAIVYPLTFERVVAGTVQAGAEDFFGAVVSPFTFGRVVNGVRIGLGQVALPLAFTATETGRVTAKSSVVSPFAFERQISGRLTAKGQTATPIVFGITVDSEGDSFGVVISPFTFGSTVSGVRETFAQTALPLSFERFSAGRLGARGQASLALAWAYTATGVRTRFGAVVLPELWDFVTDGTVQGSATGTVILPLGFGISTTGIVSAKGRVFLPLTVSETTLGRLEAKGRIDLPLTFALQTLGKRGQLGSVDSPFVWAVEVDGGGFLLLLDPITTGRIAQAYVGDGGSHTNGRISATGNARIASEERGAVAR